MNFDQVFSAILRLNAEHESIYAFMESRPDCLLTVDDKAGIIYNAESNYEPFRNNDFLAFSNEEREVLNEMIAYSRELMDKIYDLIDKR